MRIYLGAIYTCMLIILGAIYTCVLIILRVIYTYVLTILRATHNCKLFWGLFSYTCKWPWSLSKNKRPVISFFVFSRFDAAKDLKLTNSFKSFFSPFFFLGRRVSYCYEQIFPLWLVIPFRDSPLVFIASSHEAHYHVGIIWLHES